LRTPEINSGFAVGADDRLAVFLSGQALAGGLRGAVFHRRLQLNTFNRADPCEAGTTNDEAGFAAFSCRALLLGRA
jgi:hypothetical protein